jgi:hypothetical protein
LTSLCRSCQGNYGILREIIEFSSSLPRYYGSGLKNIYKTIEKYNFWSCTLDENLEGLMMNSLNEVAHSSNGATLIKFQGIAT